MTPAPVSRRCLTQGLALLMPLLLALTLWHSGSLEGTAQCSGVGDIAAVAHGVVGVVDASALPGRISDHAASHSVVGTPTPPQAPTPWSVACAAAFALALLSALSLRGRPALKTSRTTTPMPLSPRWPREQPPAIFALGVLRI